MPSKVIVDVEVPQPPPQASASTLASASASAPPSIVPSVSASAPSPAPSQPIAIDDDDDDAASDYVVAVQKVESVTTATKTTTKKKAGGATGKSTKAAAADAPQQQQQDVPSSASDAKTVTPKAESKKKTTKKKSSSSGGAGRSKKSAAAELPANQRTLGSFFGAPAAARTKKKAATAGASTGTTVKAKSISAKAGSNEATATSVSAAKVDDTAAEASLSTTDAEDKGKGEVTTGATKAKTKTTTTTAAKKAKKKSATTKATKTKTKSQKRSSSTKGPPPSDEIKAIVLGSSYKKKESSTSASTSIRPSAELLVPTKRGMMDIPITSTAGVDLHVGIPCSLILNQRQIKEQEEKARAERERAEAQSTSKKDAEPGTAVEESDANINANANANAVNSLPSSSFISPTPAKKKKKAKKRATLIPVTAAPAANKADSNASAAADETSKPSADGGRGGEEGSTGPKPAMELDEDDATVDIAPPHDNEDGESLHSGEDDIMSVDEEGMVEPDEHPDIDPIIVDDGDDDDDQDSAVAEMEIDLTGTAAKGSAVEGAKVLDLTLGEESGDGDGDDAACNDAGAGQAAEVSKRLSFTPKKNKKKADAATAGKDAVKLGGLDAFAVPISSIKASKEAKKKAEPTKKSTTPAQSGSSYVNKRIAKEFDNGIVYRGTVTKYTEDDSADGLWHILYDDGDEEDFSLSELEAGMKLFESESKKVPDGSKRAAPKAAAAPVEVEPELPEEFKAVLAKHETLRKRYRMRAGDLVNRSTELVEEDFERVVQPREDASVCAPEDGSFPESLRQDLAVLVQGSPLPLSTLTANAVAELAKLPAGKNLTADIVSDKIKIMAARKQYLTTLSPSAIQVDRFEDSQADLVWRWELSTLDLLPSELISEAKKAQAGRRKLQNFHKAVVKLLASLDKADALFLKASSPKVKRDAALAKVSTDEDKVLKYERDEEKQRLAREAKAKKEAEKEQAKQQKEQQKKLAAEKKEQEKKLAAEEKEQQKKLAAEEKEQQKKLAAAKREEERERKKQEAAKAKEEAKRKREEEKAEKKRKAEEKEEKQKARMMSFFGQTTPPRKAKAPSRNRLLSQDAPNASQFDTDAFWKSLGTADTHSSNPPPFKKLTNRAKQSRKRKTEVVSMTVFTTVLPDNPFDQQPYDEERTLQVPNKYKFLGFHEDYRPPYHGTWSKPRSSIVTGCNPFGRDTTHLDYDVDSEAEWEEGDDEEGEDCDVDGPDDDEEDKIEDEEGDTRVYNYDDGWLAQDDEIDGEDSEESDKEALAIQKKRTAEDSSDQSKKQSARQSTVCVVAPVMGGIPLVETGSDTQDCPELVSELVDGAGAKVGMSLLSRHDVFDLMPYKENCLDLFPATKVKAKKSKQKKASDKEGADASPGRSQAKANKEMTQDDLRAFAKFVHNSTLGSKDKVIEELQTALPDVTSSRAQAIRKLDSIAEKRRLKHGSGVVWEVKKDVLKSLGLEAKDLNPAPVEKEPEKKDASPPKRKKAEGKKEKDPNAPKRNMSSYMFYSNENRSKFKEANPEASFGDLAKIISKAFKELSEEEKKPYEEKAAADRERYKKEMDAYDGPKEPPAKKAKHSAGTKPAKSDATKVVEDGAAAATPAVAATVTPKSTDTNSGEKKNKKRSPPAVSEASKNLFAAFLKQKKKKPKTDTTTGTTSDAAAKSKSQ